ncbi:PorH family porin [Corynebacterium pseudogenitalium]|uniref:PorH family porin n=1 Tax=Corynebacterium pseudogenitalium TaxID=38303 RepID=A0ABD4TRT5_9CORY|nr:PorH family porin [Corynebacterium pseudogenitalium]MCQ4608401.1 PorH family porin [Corynebacterium pseudogenitalium]MCQ4615022.1 PorH family porin [Corynebacterium pseudogenitalium]
MDLAVITDALKDFSTFAGNIVKLFRLIPDLLINFGELGQKKTELPN